MSSEQIKQLLNESAIVSAPIDEVEILSQGSEPLTPAVPSAVPEASPEKQASNILSAQSIPVPIRNAEPSGTSHVLKTRKDLIQKITEVCETRGIDHKPMNLQRLEKTR